MNFRRKLKLKLRKMEKRRIIGMENILKKRETKEEKVSEKESKEIKW